MHVHKLQTSTSRVRFLTLDQPLHPTLINTGNRLFTYVAGPTFSQLQKLLLLELSVTDSTIPTLELSGPTLTDLRLYLDRHISALDARPLEHLLHSVDHSFLKPGLDLFGLLFGTLHYYLVVDG